MGMLRKGMEDVRVGGRALSCVAGLAVAITVMDGARVVAAQDLKPKVAATPAPASPATAEAGKLGSADEQLRAANAVRRESFKKRGEEKKAILTRAAEAFRKVPEYF